MGEPLALSTVLGEIVSPAIAAVLRADEVDSVYLIREPVGQQVEYRLVVVAKDEQFQTVAYDSSAAYPPGGPMEVLRDQLVDFVAESHFGWGQNRDTQP